MGMVKSSNIEEAIKALYAVSSLIRSNLYGQELFYADGGVLMLQVSEESEQQLLVNCFFEMSVGVYGLSCRRF